MPSFRRAALRRPLALPRGSCFISVLLMLVLSPLRAVAFVLEKNARTSSSSSSSSIRQQQQYRFDDHLNSFSRNNNVGPVLSATGNSVFQGFDLGAILFGNAALVDKKKKKNKETRERLKTELLDLCRLLPEEKKTLGEKQLRAKIEAKIDELAPLSPVTATASSPLLQKEWVVVWTTEKEINVFLDFGWATEVSQTIDANGNLQNMIPFAKGGSFGVSGTLTIPSSANDDEASTGTGKRTNFVFDTATLDLQKWGTYQVPPVGEGWFDTLYLDDNLRVDINSRDDILICQPR